MCWGVEVRFIFNATVHLNDSNINTSTHQHVNT
jgi:hypothetical protein